jgi:hypothetical protein
VPELQALRLTYLDAWSDDLARLPVTDADLRAVVSRLPNLVELTMEATAPFTSRAVRYVGEHCRQLQSLSLDAELVVSELEGASVPVLFPHLQLLELRLPDESSSLRYGCGGCATAPNKSASFPFSSVFPPVDHLYM